MAIGGGSEFKCKGQWSDRISKIEFKRNMGELLTIDEEIILLEAE